MLDMKDLNHLESYFFLKEKNTKLWYEVWHKTKMVSQENTTLIIKNPEKYPKGAKLSVPHVDVVYQIQLEYLGGNKIDETVSSLYMTYQEFLNCKWGSFDEATAIINDCKKRETIC